MGSSQGRKRALDSVGAVLMQWAMYKDKQKQQLEQKIAMEDAAKEKAKLMLEKRKQDMDWFKTQLELRSKADMAATKEQRGYDEGKDQQKAISDRIKETIKKREQLEAQRHIGDTKPVKGMPNKLLLNKGSGKWDLVDNETAPQYTKQQLVDDTRGYYSLFMDAIKDDRGYVPKDKQEEYNNLAGNMKADMFAIGNGMFPSWLKETPKGKETLSKIQEQTKQPVSIIIPESKLPDGMETPRVMEALKGSPPGVYEVDKILFRWNGKIAIPYEKQSYTGKISADGTSTNAN